MVRHLTLRSSADLWKIPAVLSIENIVSIVNDGDEVVLDGSTGEAFINPEASVVEEYKAKKAKFLEEKAAPSEVCWTEIPDSRRTRCGTGC